MTFSFRTRMTAIAALVVAGVIATVLWLAWSSVGRVEVERLESRLCLEARRLAAQPLRGDDMNRLEADMMMKLRLGTAEQLMLRREPGDGSPAYQSRNWGNLRLDDLAWVPAPGQQAAGPPDRPREGRPPPRDAGQPAPPERPPRATCSLGSFVASGTQWRAAMVTSDSGRGIVAADVAAATAELEGAVQGALAMVIPLALALVAFVAWLLSALMMRPVGRLRDAMAHVSRKALDQRLSAAGEDREFRELIDAYNTMLARLEASFEQASRFSADAAHELKTPLTILQGRIEQAIRKAEQGDVQADLTDMLDEVGRLSAITRKLLLLSQADAGRLALHVTPVDLTELLDELLADARMLADGQNVSDAIERGLTVHGDVQLLRQLFNNLISNAVRYCPADGWVEVAARRLANGVEVIFANASRPIPGEDRKKFFDRFYRGDPAHGREIEGSGLGLSLAREIARAHGGDLTLEPGPDDAVKLRLWLPSR